MKRTPITRRQFLYLSSLGVGATALAACAAPGTEAPTATSAPAPTAVPATAAGESAQVVVGDVMDYALKGDWPGRFGFVKFRLHAGFSSGERAYFIRTDASDQAFAQSNGLVWVPLLTALESKPEAAAKIYLFEGGSAEQLPILSTDPSKENYSPIFQVHRVTGNGSAVYDSEEKLMAAESAGEVSVAAQPVWVNYPVVKWPGGELSVDDEKMEYLGGGQCLEPVNSTEMSVTFKLHECYPGSRYIVTDTSAVPMAPMMAVAPAGAVHGLYSQEAAPATAKIWVFANGVPGSGVMGFQPAIFDSKAGDAVWSPLWNHFTLKWKDGATPRVLTSQADVQAALAAGEVEEFNGTPDTHPNGFIVNCPVPVLAPNTFEA